MAEEQTPDFDRLDDDAPEDADEPTEPAAPPTDDPVPEEDGA